MRSYEYTNPSRISTLFVPVAIPVPSTFYYLLIKLRFRKKILVVPRTFYKICPGGSVEV